VVTAGFFSNDCYPAALTFLKGELFMDMNWRQEVAAETTAIEDVNANPAMLIVRIDTLGEMFGGSAKVVELQRHLSVNAPEPVNLRLVDGKNYVSGDFVCRVAFVYLKEAFEPLPQDPEIRVNGVVKTLTDLRPFTADNNWGIDVGDDKIVIGGDAWTIAAIRGLKWLGGEPAEFEFTLRS
jgi:hypothetical protein